MSIKRGSSVNMGVSLSILASGVVDENAIIGWFVILKSGSSASSEFGTAFVETEVGSMIRLITVDTRTSTDGGSDSVTISSNSTSPGSSRSLTLSVVSFSDEGEGGSSEISAVVL